MPSIYAFHHIHLRTCDPQTTAQYYQDMFDAERVEYIQVNGKIRVHLNLNGITILIGDLPAGAEAPKAPSVPYLGLDHFGLRVDDLDSAAAELKHRGATFIMEPITVQPGIRAAFIQGPDDVRIELVEWALVDC
jgi:catechol 2,3-dioxygenase-like lactoylglutathione lyase family enzyme